MFDRENFKIFVGPKSATSYVSGLKRIEELYDTNIDERFGIDECASLIEKLKFRKKDNSLSETERKAASDMHSHLIKYVAFRNSINSDDEVNEKIKSIITLYKDDFKRINNEERFKWEAIHTYKKVWNIDAENFASMISSAFRNHGTLLRAGNYFPYKMLIIFAEAEPETVRSLFKTLYDEALPFDERFKAFRGGFNKFYGPQNLNSYQDLHAVSVYLTFEYPEKHYIYKYRVLKNFVKAIGYNSGNIDSMSDAEKYNLLSDVCGKVLELLDDEVKEISMERLDENCYADEAFHILAHDIIYFGSQNVFPEDEEVGVYWPSPEEYDPQISEAEWMDILNDRDITTIDTLRMLKMILMQGGESTCANLAEKYGNTHNHYNKLGSNFGERVKKALDCPDCIDDGQVRFFPIPFLGRYITENGNNRYSWKLRDELKAALENTDLSDIDLTAKEELKMNISKNTILYGPPGTGKTYNTVLYAVAIIENKNLSEVKAEEYNDVLSRYNEYKNEGLIEFTTFHQSYGYEEFIEGIKPILNSEGDESDVKYTMEDGLFKAFCSRSSIPVAKKSDMELGLNKNPTIWKVSLWSTGDNPIRTECHENGHIRIGWDMYGAEITEDTDFSENGGKNVLNAFISQMKIGDIVFSCYSSTTIDAIGVVSGEYEWCGEEYDELNRRRKVNWIVKDIREDIVEINGGNTMTLASVYRLKNITLSDAIAIIEKYLPQAVEEKKNHVFIIDEINRGNISKIFGELITLIEPTKRIGQTEGMKIRLPYSQTMFGVPDNVYILGTMNTADRSIAAIDTALRRRFRFKEIMPDVDVLNGITVEGVIIKNMLDKINKRITALYDREHTIGHSYFLPLKDNPTLDTLAVIFSDDIIPLLQEYFYEDYEKIRLVLGDNKKSVDDTNRFIIATQNDYNELFGNTEGFDESFSYEINNEAFYNIEAYRKI